MTVWRITAQVDSESVTQNRAFVTEPYLLIYALADRDSWLRVIRDARCAHASLDADQWFPISADVGQARKDRTRSKGAKFVGETSPLLVVTERTNPPPQPTPI